MWDPPSHGESRPFPLDWSLDDLALMLEQILPRGGFERPILVGQSMGGYVSRAFIRLFPDRACGFVSARSVVLHRDRALGVETCEGDLSGDSLEITVLYGIEGLRR